MPIDFVGQAYSMLSKQLDAQTCINYYVTVDPTGKFKKANLPRPALELYVDDDSEKETRGGIVINEILYVVIDSVFYTIKANLIREKVGDLKTSTGLVKMITNGFQIFISDIFNGYVYQILDAGTRKAGDFFVVDSASSVIGEPTFFGAGLNDMITSGTYTGDESRKYRIVIDGKGSPDTFKWSNDNGKTYQGTTVPITGGLQDLEDGVEIAFLNVNGHTVNDYWNFDVEFDPTFYVPVIPTALAARGVYPRQNTQRFYYSGLNDFSVINALAYESAEAYADNLIAALSIHGELWLFGSQTIEVWYVAQDADLPFLPRNNLVLNYGCTAPYSLTKAENNAIFLLGRNIDGGRIVLRITNYNADIISTEPLNQELRSYEKVDDALGMVIERNGHVFYILTFPSADKTWSYDMTTGMWFEWKSEIDNTFPYSFPNRQGRWLPNWHVVFNGENVVGDSQSGKIYRLSENVYTDNGRTIRYERVSAHLSKDNQLMEINSLELDIERGEGLVEGQGENPQIMLQISRDGGKTWGNELWRSGGKLGEFKKRVIWYNLGTARVFTFRVRITDPVYNVLLGAIADVRVYD
jgi:hypothetical protein